MSWIHIHVDNYTYVQSYMCTVYSGRRWRLIAGASVIGYIGSGKFGISRSRHQPVNNVIISFSYYFVWCEIMVLRDMYTYLHVDSIICIIPGGVGVWLQGQVESDTLEVCRGTVIVLKQWVANFLQPIVSEPFPHFANFPSPRNHYWRHSLPCPMSWDGWGWGVNPYTSNVIKLYILHTFYISLPRTWQYNTETYKFHFNSKKTLLTSYNVILDYWKSDTVKLWQSELQKIRT